MWTDTDGEDPNRKMGTDIIKKRELYIERLLYKVKIRHIYWGQKVTDARVKRDVG